LFKLSDDLALVSYMVSAFGHMAFRQRQMLLPHSAVHVIQPRLKS
jgi:hypothetical protein